MLRPHKISTPAAAVASGLARRRVRNALLAACVVALATLSSSLPVAQSQQPRERFEARYNVQLDQAVPKVYWRITNDWLDLTLRYLAPERGTREIKDAINRTIITEFDASGIELANTTIEVVFPGRS